MKKFALLFFAVCLAVTNHQADNPITKHALIIAIGDYPEETNWGKISSVNDIPLIRSALERQGFDHFTILKDAQADKDAIVDALRQLSKDVNKGDIVVVHFSSHGQQIMDNNRDEIDGYDEAIVAYGAPALFDPAYDGENHLRDEELGAELDKIRTKLGSDGDVLVIVDACHSGTATRGPKAQEVSRGGQPPLAPKDYRPAAGKKSKEVGVFEENRASTRGGSKSPLVVISAARADELNYEYNGFGSLSVAFNKALDQLDTGFTYRSLFSKIVKEMTIIAPNQTPALEGDIDRKLFGGKVVQQEAYYNLSRIRGTDARIEGGQVVGLNIGSKIKIFAEGTISTKDKKPLATGEVYFADGFSCGADLDSNLEGDASEYWVFVEQLAFGDVSIGLCLDHISPKSLKNTLTEQLKDFPLANVNDTSIEFNVFANANGTVKLVSWSNGKTFRDNISLADDAQELKDVVTDFAQGKFLKILEFKNPHYNIELELIPIRLIGDRVDTLDPKDYMDEGGMLSFTPGDQAIMRIKNHGKFDVYFNILDIEPNGRVNPVIPDPSRNENPRDFRISKGQVYDVPDYVINFGEPYGVETFKIFASYKPLNLTPIARSRGEGVAHRGVENELEKLFRGSYTMSRGTTVGTLSSSSKACTFSYTFKITDK